MANGVELPPDVEVEKIFTYLKVKGVYYALAFKDGKPTFIKQDKKEVEKVLKMVDEVAEKLGKAVNGKFVIKEAVKNMGLKEIKKLHKMLFKSKREYKPKTREGHCVDMKIGNFILPLID